MPTPLPAAHAPRRFAFSAWTIIRPDAVARPLASASQLGASQAGFRWRRDWHKPLAGVRMAANLRASTPLAGPADRELAIGLAVRPEREPRAELIIERRVSLDRRGDTRMALLMAGGVDDQRLPFGVRLSAYGQAGVVGISRRMIFGDGRFTLTAPIDRHPDRAISAGIGVAGGAQRAAARLDTGPLLLFRHRIGAGGITIAAEYRWRIAGQARPPSGPVLSLGAGF